MSKTTHTDRHELAQLASADAITAPEIDFCAAPGKRPYSYLVMIDGEHRATFRPDHYGERGYALLNARGAYIRETARRSPQLAQTYEPVVKARRQADFEKVILRCLDADLIPNAGQLDEDAARGAATEAARRAERQRDQDAADALERIQRLGPALLQHLEIVCRAVAELEGTSDLDAAPKWQKLRRATAGAIKTIADAHGRRSDPS